MDSESVFTIILLASVIGLGAIYAFLTIVITRAFRRKLPRWADSVAAVVVLGIAFWIAVQDLPDWVYSVVPVAAIAAASLIAFAGFRRRR